jgi:hypothetical protein
VGDATKTFPTRRAIAWLKTLVLPELDRLELDYPLADLEHIERRVEELGKVIAQRCQLSEDAVLLTSIPGAAAFAVTPLAMSRPPEKTAVPRMAHTIVTQHSVVRLLLSAPTESVPPKL